MSEELTSRWDNFLLALRFIESVVPNRPGPKVLTPETILYALPDVNGRHSPPMPAGVKSHLAEYGFDKHQQRVIDDVLDTAAFLGNNLLLTEDRCLIANTVKKLKAAGYPITSITGANTNAKIYLSVQLKNCILVLHVDLDGNPVVDAAKWYGKYSRGETKSLWERLTKWYQG